MRKAAFLAIIVFALPALAQEVGLDCIGPGCTIVLLQRAQFIENTDTCEWEYVPGNASGGHVLVRGRQQKFNVLKIEERGGVEFVIATQNILFENFGQSAGTFCFPRIYLDNPRAFRIQT